MARIPTYQDVGQHSLDNTRRVLQGPQPVGIAPAVVDHRGEAVANAGSAVVELTNRVRDAQIENEVRKADIKTQVALQRFKDGLSSIDDETQYEKQWNDGARKIISETANGLSSPLAQQAFGSRGEELFNNGLMSVRDMARRKGVEKANAGVIELGATAKNLLDDPTATDELRMTAVNTASAAADGLVRRGFMGADDAARFKIGLNEYATKKTQERTQLAQAQGFEDKIWTESGGDYGKASEAVRDIKDPIMRDLVQNRIDDRYSNQVRLENQQEEEASQEVAKIFVRGGTLSSVPASTLAKLKPSTLLSLQASERAELRSRQADERQRLRDASDVNKGALEAFSYENPTEFAKDGALEAAIQKYALTPADASSLLVRRAQIRSGKIDSQNLDAQIYKSVKSIAGPMLDKYTSDRKGKSQAVVANAIDSAILSESRAFAEREKRQPNAKETQEIIGRAILKLDKSVVSKTQLGAPSAKNVKATSAANLPYESIPADARRAITLSLQKRLGKVPTNWDVRNEYARYLQESENGR